MRAAILLRSATSALASGGMLWLADWAAGFATIAPGALFGAIVLAPEMAPASAIKWPRARIILLSTIIHYGASLVALGLAQAIHRGLAGAVGGSVGALLLAIAGRPLLNHGRGPVRWIEIGLFGTLGGAALGAWMESGSDLALIVGFGIWQVGVGWALLRRVSPSL